jgi:tyrosine-protein kinase Etk/Wzc
MQSDVNSEQIQVAESQDLHLLDLLIILAKRRKFILRFTLGTAALAVIAVLVLPSRYTAETVVLPPGQNSSMSSALLSQVGGAGGLAAAAGASLGIKNPADMYVSLIKSRTVEDAVIQRFGLMARYHEKKQSGARAQLEAHSKVVLGAKDGLITLSVTDRDPKQAAIIANGYIDEYRKFSANLAITEASQRRLFFQQQLLEANESLAAAEDALKHTEQSTGVLEVDSQARSLIESAAELRAQVVAKEVQLQGMRAYATEDNPELMMGKQELVALQEQLAKLAGTDKNSSDDVIVPKGNIPEAGMQYLRKLRDVKYYETISELMAKQFELAKLDEARQGASLQVVDAAVPPDSKSFPKPTITVLVAILLGFFLASVWCVLAEGLQRIKGNPDEGQRMDALRAILK